MCKPLKQPDVVLIDKHRNVCRLQWINFS